MATFAELNGDFLSGNFDNLAVQVLEFRKEDYPLYRSAKKTRAWQDMLDRSRCLQ